MKTRVSGDSITIALDEITEKEFPSVEISRIENGLRKIIDEICNGDATIYLTGSFVDWEINPELAFSLVDAKPNLIVLNRSQPELWPRVGSEIKLVVKTNLDTYDGKVWMNIPGLILVKEFDPDQLIKGQPWPNCLWPD